MKRVLSNRFILCFIGLFLIFVSCKETKSEQSKNIHLETVEIVRNGTDIDSDTTKVYEAEVKYHVVIDAPSAVKDSIDRKIRLFLSNWFNVPEKGDFNLSQLVSEDMREFYKKVDAENLHDCFTCRVKQIKITGGDYYQNNHIVSIPYKWYTYEGGAHGNYGTICYVFNKKSGKIVSYKDLVKNEDKLLEVAEKAFREQMGIKGEEATPDMFTFEGNKFALNDNFAFSEDALTFYYNPYEIAPYAAGLIELKLPYEQIKGLVNYIE